MGFPGCPHPLRHTAVRYEDSVLSMAYRTCVSALDLFSCPRAYVGQATGKTTSPRASIGWDLSYRVASPGGHRRPGACRAGLLGSAYLTSLGDCALSPCRVITAPSIPTVPGILGGRSHLLQSPFGSLAGWVHAEASTTKSCLYQKLQCSLCASGAFAHCQDLSVHSSTGAEARTLL